MKKIITIIFTVILLCGCQNKEYNVNDNIEINGIVENKSLKDGKISILNLDNEIIIDGVKVSRLALDYDKDFKDKKEVDLEGTIISTSDNNFDISYTLKIDDVNPSSAIENTFSSNDFTMTIPTDLIKLCSIKKLDNGFIIYSKSSLDNGGEVFRLVSISNKEFKALQVSEDKTLEKGNSNSEKTVVVIYPSTNQIVNGKEDDYATIGDAINQIKESIRLN